MKHILIAGGTGLIGKLLAKKLLSQGYQVQILTRNPIHENEVRWSPQNCTIDSEKVKETEVLINLCGESIDAKRWTKNRKKALNDSRVGTTNILFSLKDNFPNLKHYVSASGITAYGMDDGTKAHLETDNYGTNYISELVKDWEKSADAFKIIAKVSKIRIAMVVDKYKGAIHRLARPIKWGIGSPVGSGKQLVNWIHSEDLVEIVAWVVEHTLAGTFNANATDVTNTELVKAVAKQLNKKLWMPKVPTFVLKVLFGELSDVLVNGTRVSNEKIKATGFVFKYPRIDLAMKEVFGK